jgi:hypothetical protein
MYGSDCIPVVEAWEGLAKCARQQGLYVSAYELCTKVMYVKNVYIIYILLFSYVDILSMHVYIFVYE